MAKLIDTVLKASMELRASDVHIAVGMPPCFRIDGDLIPTTSSPLSQDDIKKMLLEILTDKERKQFEETRNVDRSYYMEQGGRFRVNIFETQKGMAAVFRSIPEVVPSMDELGLPESLKKVTEFGKGLVLITGPTGSGKSTTMAAMINEINLNCRYHILTVEDPIEFVHQNKKSLVNQRQIGQNCNSFADALKGALREDPDVILVGELRDLETIALALTAAETGHIVFGTLHTRGAGSSIDRIIDSFPANQQAMIRTMLSESLAAVVSQALLKKPGGEGRVAAYEILMVNHAISNLIREGKTFQIASTMQTSRGDGMILMDQYITNLVKEGKVDPLEAEGYMEDPSPLKAFTQKARWQSAKPAAKEKKSDEKAPPPMGAPPKMPPKLQTAKKSPENLEQGPTPPVPQAAPVESKLNLKDELDLPKLDDSEISPSPEAKLKAFSEDIENEFEALESEDSLIVDFSASSDSDVDEDREMAKEPSIMEVQDFSEIDESTATHLDLPALDPKKKTG